MKMTIYSGDDLKEMRKDQELTEIMTQFLAWSQMKRMLFSLSCQFSPSIINN